MEKQEASEVVVEEPEDSEMKMDKPEALEVVVEELEASEVRMEKPEASEVVVEEPEDSEMKMEEPEASKVVKVEKPEATAVVVEEPEASKVKVEKPEATAVVVEEPEASKVKVEKPEATAVVVEEPEASKETTREFLENMERDSESEIELWEDTDLNEAPQALTQVGSSKKRKARPARGWRSNPVQSGMRGGASQTASGLKRWKKGNKFSANYGTAGKILEQSGSGLKDGYKYVVLTAKADWQMGEAVDGISKDNYGNSYRYGDDGYYYYDMYEGGKKLCSYRLINYNGRWYIAMEHKYYSSLNNRGWVLFWKQASSVTGLGTAGIKSSKRGQVTSTHQARTKLGARSHTWFGGGSHHGGTLGGQTKSGGGMSQLHSNSGKYAGSATGGTSHGRVFGHKSGGM
ncbi:hypothetical protein Ciccas_012808 [Cichlidogyrus casuarinus]|uniref:Uncharacterized protein n=1 Tax=Cichlidogyrus casuarinus TaxID=1844966 RepID=A0ABD2PMC9_9PLAT